MSNQNLIGVQEVSEKLGVSIDCIYTMVRSKEIPHVRCRSRIVFRPEKIDEWIEQEEKRNFKSS